jgi:hypothetical protein
MCDIGARLTEMVMGPTAYHYGHECMYIPAQHIRTSAFGQQQKHSKNNGPSDKWWSFGNSIAHTRMGEGAAAGPRDESAGGSSDAGDQSAGAVPPVPYT